MGPVTASVLCLGNICTLTGGVSRRRLRRRMTAFSAQLVALDQRRCGWGCADAECATGSGHFMTTNPLCSR